MFKIVNEKELIVKKDKQKVLDQITLEIATDQLGNITLDLTDLKQSNHNGNKGAYDRYEFIYSLEKKANVSLIFHCYEKTIQAFVEARLESERLFALNDSFQANDGIRIHVKDVPNMEKMVAHYRHKDWWSRPYFDTNLTDLPKRTTSITWKKTDSNYQLMTIVGETFKTEMQGAEKGFTINVSSNDHGRESCQTPLFVLTENENTFDLIKQTITEIGTVIKKEPFIENKRYPEKLDYFGWCSWDAFYQTVNEKGIVEKIQELNEQNVPVKWVMIDDGWSEIKDDRLHAFTPDQEKFPNGFKTLTKKLRQDYGIESIGVWHTLAGYWGGVDPNSKLADDMQAFLYKTTADKLIPYPQKGKGFSFWDAWHQYLKEQGIDFVKVDGQSAIHNFLNSQKPIGQASTETHKGLEASVGIHFDQNIINCMGMAPENIWNRPISAVSRSSDDFVPDDEQGFAEHAVQNVYNSYYHGEFYYGDWDMFWTKHKDAKRHALLRAMSGGPIYTSDKVGETDANIIQSLIYQNGRIVRCDQVGRPTADTLMVNPTNDEVPLTVWNKSNGVGVIAAFHIHPEANEVSGIISPSDIQDLNAERYIVFDYYNQKVEQMNKTDKKIISLSKDEYVLYQIIPLREKVTPVGLIDKYISSHTYRVLSESANKMIIQLKEAGRFAFVSEESHSEIIMNGKRTTAMKTEGLYIVDCTDEEGEVVIELDY